MYTRFKSQKTGVKIGLNSIANTSRSARVVLSSDLVTSTASASAAASTTPATQVQPTSLLSTYPLIESTASVLVTEHHQLEDDQAKTITDAETVEFPISINSDGIPLLAKMSSFQKTRSSKNKNNSSASSHQEESCDLPCISYVRSLWEKYSSEIGKQNGPLVYTADSASEYEHLNNFVPFDMEHWWAERSISAMLNGTTSNASTNSNDSSVDRTNTSLLMSSSSSSSSSPVSSQQSTSSSLDDSSCSSTSCRSTSSSFASSPTTSPLPTAVTYSKLVQGDTSKIATRKSSDMLAMSFVTSKRISAATTANNNIQMCIS